MTIQKQAQDFMSLVADNLTEPQIDYLAWRVCGFTKTESATRAKVTSEDLREWIEDGIFARIENLAGNELRKVWAEELIHQQHVKNVAGIMAIDSQVIDETLRLGLDNVSEETRDYLGKIRNQYNPTVRKYLGLEEEDRDRPKSFDELTLRFRRVHGEAESEEYQEGSSQS